MSDEESRLTLEERGLVLAALGMARNDAQHLAACMIHPDGELHFNERAEQYRKIAFKVSRWGVRKNAETNLAS